MFAVAVTRVMTPAKSSIDTLKSGRFPSDSEAYRLQIFRAIEDHLPAFSQEEP
jgi:hypothetical protein